MIKKKEGFDGQRAIVLPRKIIAKFCHHHPLPGGIYITDIGYYPKAQYHFRQRLHGSDQHILIYCLEGKGNACINKKKYELQPGSFIVIPAGTPHSYSADEENSWTIYWIHFKGVTANQLVDVLLKKLNGPFGTLGFQQKRLHLFEDIYACLERGYGNDNLSYTSMCLMHFLSSFMYNDKFNLSETKHSNDEAELSISYMQKNLTQLLTLKDIAQSVNLSASHYSAIFKKKTGYAPIEYFNHLKIQKACQFLIFTDLRIKEIAFRLGIEDPYYFSRMFNKLMGVSPVQYRSKRSL
jgi:AraC-like DNA-binding protein